MTQRRDFLQQVDIFAGASAAELAAVNGICREQTCEAGDVIFSEGAKADSLLVVREGQVSCERDGEQLTVMGPGETFGVTSFLDDGPRNVDALAVGHVRLIVVDRAPFMQLAGELPGLMRGLYSVTNKHLRSVLDVAASHRGLRA